MEVTVHGTEVFITHGITIHGTGLPLTSDPVLLSIRVIGLIIIIILPVKAGITVNTTGVYQEAQTIILLMKMLFQTGDRRLLSSREQLKSRG
jgi:hypothetical protein